MDKKQDDLTLVYMWAYKQAKEEYRDRIEELEAALRESYKFEETLMRISHLADQHPVFDDALKAYTRCASIARAALGEKKDG